MDYQKVATYKKKLEEERAKLIEELKKDQRPEDFGSDAGHSDEETDEAESFGNHLAAGQALKDRINEIDAALNKIKESKYGICESCGKEIEEAVLKVSPESRYCKSCKLRIK